MNHVIDNIIPTDFNYDGKLDILVVSHTSTSTDLFMRVYYGDGISSLSDPEILSYTGTTQPFVADLHGDMRLDIIGPTKDSVQVYTYTPANSVFTQYRNIC